MIRAVLVDDEPLVRENLRLRLSGVDDVEVVAECADGREAVDVVREAEPDVLFLDVQMPEWDGFDVLERLEPLPYVIFVTAHDEYAVRAFEVNALDYLLKPIDADRFASAIDRARHAVRDDTTLGSKLRHLLDTVATEDAPAEPSAQPRPRPRPEPDEQTIPEKLVVKSRGQIHFVPVDTVHHLTSAGDYVEVHTSSRTHLMRSTLAGVTERLGPDFVRIHRSATVRISTIRTLEPIGHYEYRVELDDGTSLKCSRTYREALDDALGTA